MTRYMRWLAAERGRAFDDYQSLWEWSVRELEEFWASIWDFFEVGASTPYSRVLAERAMPGASWFEGAELNFAEHVFRDKPRGRAWRCCTPPSSASSTSFAGGSFATRSPRVAAGLRGLGVERGDRVVAYMPNIPETLVAFLATASIGAIWSSCSPDFGAASVVDRFAQIEPKVLFCVDGYRYNGRDFDRLDTSPGSQREIPTLERTVVVPYLAPEPDLAPLDCRDSPGTSSSPGEGRRARASSRSRPTTRSGSSTRRGRPACRRRSSRDTPGSCSSTSRS